MTADRFDPATAEKLEALGHKIRWTNTAGVTQAIVRDPATGVFTGVFDPRAGGAAAGQ